MTSASGRTESKSCATVTPSSRKDLRHQRGRADQRDARAEFGQRPDIGTRHAAEEDVAANDHMEVLPVALAAEPLAHGEGIEQRLGGMLVRAVAGVDDVGLEPLGEELRRARGGVAQDDEVGLHRLEHLAGVLQRLALAEGTRGAVDGDDVGVEAGRGQLERGARARARLDEEIHHRAALQRGDFLTRRASKSLKVRPVSRINSISARSNSRMVRRSLRVQAVLIKRRA